MDAIFIKSPYFKYCKSAYLVIDIMRDIHTT